MRVTSSREMIRGRLLLACLVVCAFPALHIQAEPEASKIVCRARLSGARRAELSAQLRAITGWAGLHFDGEGALSFGAEPPSGGSQSARGLLAAAQAGKNLIILEDASGRADVAFSRVLEGGWKDGSEGKPAAYVIQIDFSDFAQVRGDRAALAAFNAGWAVLHEVEHAVRDAGDAEGPGKAGECEEAINRMRRECGLAERADYFYAPMPDAWRGDFKTRYVRLAFDDAGGGKRRRYWLFWDAETVGGLPAGQVAAR